jgi:hypothetical protein
MNGSPEYQRAARGLAQEFPGVTAWYGEQTRQWWAMVPVLGGHGLLSAPDIHHLREAIINARSQPWRQS